MLIYGFGKIVVCQLPRELQKLKVDIYVQIEMSYTASCYYTARYLNLFLYVSESCFLLRTNLFAFILCYSQIIDIVFIHWQIVRIIGRFPCQMW